MTRVNNESAPAYAAGTDDAIIARAIAIVEARMFSRDSEELGSAKVAGDYLRLKLAPREREVFAVLFLDTRHRVIAYEELFYGTIDGAEVQPREVIKTALQHNAAALILAHNHPSGVSTPSAADKALTARLRDALRLVGLRLLDHFIVGAGEPYSMAEHGEI